MSKEIIIHADKNQTRIALIEDGELAELHIESTENERTLGDIYLGQVRRTMPSIQAAFIDIGQKQDAFLHYSDLADNLPQWLKLLEHNKPNVSEVAPQIDDLPTTARSRSRRSSGPSKTSQGKGRHGRDAKDEKQDVVAADTDVKQAVEEGDDQGGENGRRRPQQRRGDHKEKRSSSRRDSRDSVPKQDGEEKPQSNAKDSARKGNSSKEGGRGGRGNSRSNSRQGKGGNRGNGNVGGRPPETFLDKGKRILVKIVKEPISAKGSRVSTDISLAGRFLVLVPLANYVAVSKKIYSYKERRRLRALARSLLPVGFGVIVRTVAEGKKAKELDTDLRLLLEKWRKIEKKLEGSPQPPVVVHADVSMASSVIRDLFSDDYDRILIDDPKLFKNVKNYVQAIAPHMVPAVQLHKGKEHIFKTAKIAHDVKEAFDSRVDLPSGGYLFIENTEAMHVVDVNSGRAGRGLSQEQNSLKVDIEAVHAITKQIRLRDLGGIIVIDFIDLRDERNRKKVYYELKKAFTRDRAVTKILPMSDFGLVEITRQRLRPSITKTFSNEEGEKKGEEQRPQQRKEKPSRSITIEGFVEKIERWITSYKNKGGSRSITLQVHPFAAAFLTQKIPAYTTRWFLKYFLRVKLVIDESLDPLGFRFINPKTGEEFIRRSANKRRGRGGNQRRNNSQRKNSQRKNSARSDDKATQKRSSPKSNNKNSNNNNKNRPGNKPDGK
ncbi:MAG: Rne/Rng family ribonuclease [Rhodothermales bacterium]